MSHNRIKHNLEKSGDLDKDEFQFGKRSRIIPNDLMQEIIDDGPEPVVEAPVARVASPLPKIGRRISTDEMMFVVPQPRVNLGMPDIEPFFFRMNASTPLQRAAANNDIEAIQRILREAQNGFNIDDRNGSGITALWFATRKGHVEAVRLLMDAGADPRHESSRNGKSLNCPKDLVSDVKTNIPNREAINALLESKRFIRFVKM